VGEEEGELRRWKVELGETEDPMGLGIFCHWSTMRNRVDNQIRQREHIPLLTSISDTFQTAQIHSWAVQFKCSSAAHAALAYTSSRLSHPHSIAKEGRNETVVKRSFDWVS
jgi:hypothetical protein